MADRRRRRKATGSDDDEITESSEDENPEEKIQEQDSFTELVPEKVTGESEYESAEEEEEEEGEGDQTQDGSPETTTDAENAVKKETNVETENLADEDNAGDEDNPADEEGGHEEKAEVLEDDDIEGGAEWKDEQREEGDGEESEIEHSKEKSLDFDEDRRNPQYIPKKGGFYEHDDRLSEVVASEEENNKILEETEKKKTVKKLWRDDGKWIHDRYHETEQNPKSTNELVTVYGYDIRNEEGPPHARRRRRYGRGPSKYTRKWEDEDAYNNGQPSKGRENENYRGGNFRGRRGSRGRQQQSRNKTVGDNEIRFDQEEFPVLDSKGGDGTDDQYRNQDKNENNNRERDEVQRQLNNESEETSKYFEDSPSKKKNFRDFNRPQRRPIRGRNRFDRARGSNQSAFANVDSTHSRSSQPTDLSDEMKNLKCNDDSGTEVDHSQDKQKRKGTSSNSHPVINSTTFERRQASIPPRLQEAAANKPKRYSSQRQRTTPESGNFQQGSSSTNSSVPPRFYDQCYQQSVYSDRSNSSRNQSGNSIMTQTFQGYETPYQESYGIRPIANSPRMFSPVSIPAGQPVISAPYVASGGNLMGYGPPQAAYTQYPFQPYAPSSAAATVGDPHDNTLSAMHSSPPQEIFRGGMAYYNTQPPPVRTVPKRPRAAIPIVPPPEIEGNERSSTEDLMEENEEGVDNDNEEVAIAGEN